jgi:formiminotetrahydrofolate cyclodeaminase
MRLTDRTLRDVLDALRSPEPTPGGGSASALAGAMGASLLAMVARLARPATGIAAEVEELETAGARCEEIANRLTDFVDADSDAYDQVVSAYRMPKGTDEEKTRRSERIQAALRLATDAPLGVMMACSEAIGHADPIARFGNRNASSDVLVGLELLGAGLRGAGFNVEINLGSLKDTSYVERVRRDASRLSGQADRATAAARRRLGSDG